MFPVPGKNYAHIVINGKKRHPDPALCFLPVLKVRGWSKVFPAVKFPAAGCFRTIQILQHED
jgi:hypothetical protein